MNIQEYWAGVKEVAARLPEQNWLISLANREKGTTAGQVIMADRPTAARRIFENTHRAATEDEIAAYKAAEDKHRGEIQSAELERKQQFALPPAVAKLVEMAISQTPAGRGPK